jgi:twitching motility protein PilT
MARTYTSERAPPAANAPRHDVANAKEIRSPGMARLDAYLRSIEKFGAAGAVLTSGQAVTLKFPTGDRNATQVTPHDLLVGMVRELAPPAALDTIDQNRPARFEIESEGRRYVVGVAPRPGMWQVTIDPAAAAAPPAASKPRAPTPDAESAREPAVEAGGIERGQYDAPGGGQAIAVASGSAALDQLTRAARAARATDLYLVAGAPPQHRVNGELVPGGNALDVETISREVGAVATAEARATWHDAGVGVFTYADGGGRIRVTLGRDSRGPTAALRLLPDEAPTLERANLGRVGDWMSGRGLVVVTGAAGAGKTVALAALVRAASERGRRVVTLEQPIEIVVSTACQRAIGEHVPTAQAGAAAAISEGADVLALGAVASADGAAALLQAVLAGHLVIATIPAPNAAVALERAIELLDGGEREFGRAVLSEALVGTVKAVVGRGGARAFEVAPRAA